MTFLGVITNVSRYQSRVFDSAGFGNERADVEKFDTVKLTETLETLDTRDQSLARYQRGRHRLLSPPKRDRAASENGRGEVKGVRTASVLAVRARKGNLGVALLRACISVYSVGLFYLVKVERC